MTSRHFDICQPFFHTPLGLSIVPLSLCPRVLAVGRTTSASTDKFAHASLTRCARGWAQWPQRTCTCQERHCPACHCPGPCVCPPFVAECLAHLSCVATRHDSSFAPGHCLVSCALLSASVRARAWDGTRFEGGVAFKGGAQFAEIVSHTTHSAGQKRAREAKE